jgi:hypothetical protein
MIPVIIIHNGKSDYLNYSILQAIKNNTVYLISDITPEITHEKLHHVDISSLINDSYKEFISVYQHLSTNPYQFELFCFLRWFILQEFMKKYNFEIVFYIDSDVLLYVDVNDEYKKYNQFDITLLHRCAPVSSFMNMHGLNNFCNFLLNTYKNKNSYNYEKIASHFFVRQKHSLGGGVCDMTLFEFFHYHSDVGGGPGKVGEMMTIIDNSTYDHNINAEDQYFDFNRIKNVIFIHGMPHVYSKKLDKMIKFNSIHFNSSAKVLMSEYYRKSK